MKKILLTSLASTLLASSVACDTTSRTFYETPAPQEIKEFKSVATKARGETVKYDPRVDILFVIDDSGSMKNHQENLRRNINRFVENIDKTKVIDFHIGVTTVYDSTRYGTIVPKNCPGFQENGALQPLKGLASAIEDRFVSRQDGYLHVLRETLNVGAKDFYSKDICQTGPEVEESLSPILESFSETNQQGANKGFWRADTLKVVIVVTDAMDESPDLTASSVAAELFRLSQSNSNDQKFRFYAVTMVPGTPVNAKNGLVQIERNGKMADTVCKLDPAFQKDKKWPSKIPDHSLAQLVRLTKGKLLSICNTNYGDELAAVGQEIRQATLKNMVYDLPFLPDETQGRELQVWFKKDERSSLKLTRNKDWFYNSQNNKVTVYGINLDWDNYPNASIDIDSFPVDPNNPDNKVLQ